jgi:tRNA threonylcarbamoyl adenosine modification protein YeaZ
MLIAVDTSTDFASLAIAKDGLIVAEASWRCGQNHTTQFLPTLQYMLKQSGLDITTATGLIVARGPGSYNGLRVGLSTVKGLAFSLNAPVVGISTLEVEAYQQAERRFPVCAVFNAGRGEVAAAIYQQTDGEWRRVLAEHVSTVEDLCKGITSPTLFCGEHLTRFGPRIKELLAENAILVSGAALTRRAGYLLELGARRLKAQDFDDPAALQPLYLRAPAITQPRQPRVEKT